MGLVGLATGTAFALVANSKKQDLVTACAMNGGSYPTRCGVPASTVNPTNDTAMTMATLSTAGFIVGGALVATGVTLFLTAPATKTPIAAHPMFGPGQAGLAIDGAF